ncbi:hypothetical protein BAZOLSSOX_2215 [uncultured Gammaproteobacteria bacterium]|nr:hypothetical protein [uncultured Gammaproteobacteria bacterium]VVH55657.1 hypothetical protein BAZOLSSOX_2215 [uncultured Gammaproteobacteria bacterium]
MISIFGLGINNNKIYWKKGDAIYVPVRALHSHFNSSKEAEVCT